MVAMMRDNIRFPEKPQWLQLDRDPKEADRERLLCAAMRGSRVKGQNDHGGHFGG